MKRIGILAFVVIALAATIPLLGRLAHMRVLTGSSPHKIFVILGFHTNFYHSWRGDTPDEAGFGTDIRVVREIIRILDEANAAGLDARGYWESDVQFTLESILPEHAPDIIEGIRRRVASGHDEVLVAPYNNGFFSAMNEDEVRAALRWAISNPWGSGVKDLFGRYVPIVRPQEAMFTPGLIPILQDEGIEGLILPYSTYPFTSFSNFVPPLPPAQRYGLTWLRTSPDGPRILLFPSVSLGDVIDFVSLEKWMLELREMQIDGTVDQDMVIHINFDADAESWLPLSLPAGFGWLPNTGGLREYIDAVNEYDWAEFATPGEYVASHTPIGEVIVDRDTADGAWDGYFSWSEKHGSQEVWTLVQQSRLYEAQARELGATLPGDVAGSLRETYFGGRDGSFYQRVKALSTTHFGMSNPMVNEERYAAATAAAGGARERALEALQAVARARANRVVGNDGDDVLYALEVSAGTAAPTDVPLRIPLLLPNGLDSIDVVDGHGAPVAFSLINRETLDGAAAVELVLGAAAARQPQPFSVRRAAAAAPVTTDDRPQAVVLRNRRVQLALSATNAVDSLTIDGEPIGGADFLTSFVTYRVETEPESFWARDWTLERPAGERLDGVQRARLRSHVAMVTTAGRLTTELTVDFTLVGDAPFVLADVAVRYPYTAKRDVLATPQQKLRKLIDSRWLEVAPFQLHPRLGNGPGEVLHVWRENYLDVVAGFPLDYGRINPRNASLDSFNHHVTGPWVAVSGGGKGLLLAQDATVRSSANFAPMRLRDEHARQALWINPFGSYYGEQMDYGHMGGNGLGRDFAQLVGPAFRPNGPSFNGQSAGFSLLLAPYLGAEPPAALQAAAREYFSPPPVVYLQTPEGVAARVPTDLRAAIELRRREVAQRSDAPVAAPRAFLASGTNEAVDLVWDPSDDPRVDAHEVQWRRVGDSAWETFAAGATHRQRISALANRSSYEFRVRARAGVRWSDWSETRQVVVGPVGEQSALDFATHIDPRFVLRIVHQALIHAVTVP